MTYNMWEPAVMAVLSTCMHFMRPVVVVSHSCIVHRGLKAPGSSCHRTTPRPSRPAHSNPTSRRCLLLRDSRLAVVASQSAMSDGDAKRNGDARNTQGSRQLEADPKAQLDIRGREPYARVWRDMPCPLLQRPWHTKCPLKSNQHGQQ